MGGKLVSDGRFDPDEMITRAREEENLFGIVVDTTTGQYISYPAVPKSNDVGKIGDDFSKKPGNSGNLPKNLPGIQENSPVKQEPLSEKSPKPDEQKPDEQKSVPQSANEDIPQKWALAGKNREKVAYKWVARGDTFPVKELLKKAGMRWDPQYREWYSHEKLEIEIEGIYIMKKKA